MRYTGLFLLILLLLFTGLSHGSHYGGEVKVAIHTDPLTLDPLQLKIGTLGWELSKALHVYPFLIGLEGEFIPDAAKSWEIENGERIIFHLRDDILFHHGEKLTACDFVFSLKLHLDPDYDSLLYHDLKGHIAHVEALDTYTVKIELVKPYGPIFYSLLFPILPEDIYEREDFSKAPIGAGPFQLVEWVPKEHLLLQAYEDFYGGRPYLDQVTFSVLEYTTALESFLRGELDVLDVRAADLYLIEEDHRLEVVRRPGTSWHYLGVNQSEGPLAHVNVRQAISYAINRQEIIDTMFYGEMIPATGPIVPLSWCYNPYVQAYSYNPARSVRLLQEAGFSKGLTITIKCSTNAVPYIELIKEQLALVGIVVEILPLAWEELSEDVRNNDFQLHYRAWTRQLDPAQGINRQFMGGGNINIAGYANPRLDELAYAATMTLDIERRKNYYLEIQEILALDLPAIFLWYDCHRSAYNKRVQNFDVHPYYAHRLFLHMRVE